MMLHLYAIACDECGKQSPCIGLGRNDAMMACADCLIKAYQLLNPPTCHTVVKISDIDELHIDGETTAIDDVYLDVDVTTTDGASFKGILHDQRQAHQN